MEGRGECDGDHLAAAEAQLAEESLLEVRTFIAPQAMLSSSVKKQMSVVAQQPAGCRASEC